jgi:hypothetical protein
MERAFHECGLTLVNLPKATHIASTAFASCGSLVVVNLPEAVEIGKNTFWACTGLILVNLPSATKIRIGAFRYCSSLITVDLPKATHIGGWAFDSTGLTSVNLPLATQIGRLAFRGTGLVSVNLPSVTEIGDWAFEACTDLISINLPMVTEIGDWAFKDCDLNSINLPMATTIGKKAFANCALTLVNIPLARIDEHSFVDCTLAILICFDTARIDALDEIMPKENKAKSVELSKTCKLIYDLTAKAVGWLKLRTRMKVAFGNVMTVGPGTPNLAEPATELQFANFTFYTFEQLRENVKKLPKPVQQIWKQYVNDKIRMYHVDITFLNQFKPGKGEGVNAFLNEPRRLRF